MTWGSAFLPFWEECNMHRFKRPKEVILTQSVCLCSEISKGQPSLGRIDYCPDAETHDMLQVHKFHALLLRFRFGRYNYKP
jgi:hypothetical protein